jgi:hypothetical protein
MTTATVKRWTMVGRELEYVGLVPRPRIAVEIDYDDELEVTIDDDDRDVLEQLHHEPDDDQPSWRA